jgi:pantoate--beta-alanine ligase
MRTPRTISELRAELALARAAGARIGLVPTMGAFHDGHLSLMRRAHEQCDLVVVSLFVNPTQFDDAGDLHAYPRDERRDEALAEQEGVEVLFAPSADEIYPHGFSTTVTVRGVSETLEGTHRGREHFDGVATVVLKLLNIVQPQVAYFGEKDAQQLLVVRRLVADLDLPVRIEGCPIIREPDGLPMSSRNARLSAEERGRARALNRALSATERAVAAGERDPAMLRRRARAVLGAAGVQTEYFELADPDTLLPVRAVHGTVLALVAARVGPVRLIDNRLLHVGSHPERDNPEVLTCNERC